MLWEHIKVNKLGNPNREQPSGSLTPLQSIPQGIAQLYWGKVAVPQLLAKTRYLVLF